MQLLTVAKAKSEFSRVSRRVIKTKKPVVIQTPEGFVQIAPYELPEVIAPFKKIRRTKEEIRLSNTFGETL